MNLLPMGGLLALLFRRSPWRSRRPGGPGQPPPDRYVLIHAGTLLAVPGTKPQSQMTVVVKNDRIAAIEKGYLTEARRCRARLHRSRSSTSPTAS